MTLGELIDRYRPCLADESVAVRRSWEEMFTYTIRHYPKDTSIETFDLAILSERLIAADIHHRIVAGYLKRWRDVLSQAERFSH